MNLDVLAIGNAIVDVIAPVEPAFLAAEGLTPGTMRLIDEAEATRLYGDMGPAREISGGSAANTAVGVAALGGRAGFIGRVADDELGHIFAHDIRAAGVHFDTPAATVPPATARCLVLVSPDGQRTMSTFLGAAQGLTTEDLAADTVAAARILYLEGYLWDPPAPREAMRHAIGAVKAAGGKVAFTLSDVFCVERHRDDFLGLLDGTIDILFANENEAMALTGAASGDEAARALIGRAPIVVITRSEQGAWVLADGARIAADAEHVTRVIDTTGAGDLFAAGFLAGYARGRPLDLCARLGAIAAAEIISHYGARPEADLKQLAGALL